MTQLLIALIQLLETKPGLGIFTLTLFAGTIFGFIFMAAKILDKVIKNLINKKKIALGKDGVTIEEATADSTTQPSQETIITLICESQTNFMVHYDKMRELREQLFDDQKKKFKTELRKYINIIKDKYFNLIKEDIYTTYGTLFSYWFDTVFDITQDDIEIILKRNHLKFKTSEEFEDVIRQCYDSTFGEVLDSVDKAPEFIKEKKKLRDLIIVEKNQYRSYLDTSLQYAKKLSCDTALKFDLEAKEFKENQRNIVQRTFPKADIDKIMEQIDNVR